jgi:hypothetical protein
MLFSFATVAISFWLGLVAVACLHWFWRAAANDGSGHSSRDYPRATGGENHHRSQQSGSEGLISIAGGSLINVSHVVINVIRATLSRATGWIAKMFRPHELSDRSEGPSLPIAIGVTNTLAESQRVVPNSESSKTLPSNQSAGAPKKKRTTRVSRQTAETRRKPSQAHQRKIDKHQAQADAEMASKVRKGQSQKKSRKMNRAATNTAKSTARTKPKISAASNASLTPKISV